MKYQDLTAETIGITFGVAVICVSLMFLSVYLNDTDQEADQEADPKVDPKADPEGIQNKGWFATIRGLLAQLLELIRPYILPSLVTAILHLQIPITKWLAGSRYSNEVKVLFKEDSVDKLVKMTEPQVVTCMISKVKAMAVNTRVNASELREACNDCLRETYEALANSFNHESLAREFNLE